jgi:hypothetical protein
MHKPIMEEEEEEKEPLLEDGIEEPKTKEQVTF